MANTFAPFGFRDLGHRDGSAPTMGLERRWIASSDTNLYFNGDPVSLSATGPYITTPSSGTTQIFGIFRGCEFYSPAAAKTLWSPYFPGSVQTSSGTADALAYVISDPEMQFTVQVSGPTSASSVAINSSQIGLNIGFAVPVSSLGNTTTGISYVGALSTSAATSSSLPFTIVDLSSSFLPPGANGADATSVSNIIVVQFNNTNRNAGTTGV